MFAVGDLRTEENVPVQIPETSTEEEAGFLMSALKVQKMKRFHSPHGGRESTTSDQPHSQGHPGNQSQSSTYMLHWQTLD